MQQAKQLFAFSTDIQFAVSLNTSTASDNYMNLTENVTKRTDYFSLNYSIRNISLAIHKCNDINENTKERDVRGFLIGILVYELLTNSTRLICLLFIMLACNWLINYCDNMN